MNVGLTVKLLNNTLFGECKLYDEDYFQYLEYVETPTGDYIKYMGNYLWDSENSPHFEEDDSETLEYFLYKEIIKIQSVVLETSKVISRHTV